MALTRSGPRLSQERRNQIQNQQLNRPFWAHVDTSRTKTPCALHAAGHCRFGEKCRNEHVGDAGSDQARKAYADSQKSKGQSPDKGNKGKGKSKHDNKDSKGKGKDKTSKGASATSPAAVATAASTVTIIEVQGKRAQEAWKSFCAFCDKALP